MQNNNRGLGLIDLAGVVAAVTLLSTLAGSTLSRVRELSKRSVCSINLMSMGMSAKIYANDFNGEWMTPPFKGSLIDDQGIDYLNDRPNSTGQPTDCGEVGNHRRYQSTSDMKNSTSAGSIALSTTRSFWMLVRSGDASVHQFVCPSSGDVVDDTEMMGLYYDFQTYQNVSYGYQVPFGPPNTRAREGADHRQIFAADKGPFYLNTFFPRWEDNERREPISDVSLPRVWRPFNSPNHGGVGVGEGQNCLFANGHVSFQRKPIAGLDLDNIYTLMTDEWEQNLPFNLMHGDPSHFALTEYSYPGQNAFGIGPGHQSSTDSLIYP